MPTRKSQAYEDLPQLLTVEEFMALARIKRTSAYRMVREGDVPVVRFGTRHVRVPKTVLLPTETK